MKKLLVVEIAGLGWDFLEKQNKKLQINWKKTQTITPAVTCSVQASFKTALKPAEHGIVANGFFFSQLHKPLFWEQNSNLIEGEFIWEKWQNIDKKVGVMFWQQSLGNNVDILMSPAPIHKHHGGMIQDCYDWPRGLYDRIKKKCGGFDLKYYWGPLASVKSTQWIVKSTIEVMQSEKPDLLFTYLPHLDYELQKSGPDSAKSKKAYVELEKALEDLLAHSHINGYETLLFGDYAIMNVDTVIYPNKVLRDEKLLNFRILEDMFYPDYYNSDAFAVVDHQVAHIKLFNKNSKEYVMQLFKQMPGVKEVIDGRDNGEFGAGHERAGDIILVAEENCWFSYQWWHKKSEAPDYATHVDIHNKPGFDACELFWGFPMPFSTSMDCRRVKGSHGLGGPAHPVAWFSTFEVDNEINSLLDLSKIVKEWNEDEDRA